MEFNYDDYEMFISEAETSGCPDLVGDPDEAFAALSTEAEEGDPHSVYLLGRFYALGIGVAPDTQEAIELIAEAAEAGDVDAQYDIGCRYASGDGVDQDYVIAIKWFRMAAEEEDARAQNYLGVCYENGDGVEQDMSEAVEWYRKAAEQGYADAQFNLGACYTDGEGAEQNVVEAVKWYRKAAEQGLACAQFFLGVCYQNGEGVEMDMSEAVKWYRKAAEQGYVFAQFLLGFCYENGEGVEMDMSEAVEWYRKAAEQGYADAEIALGECYEHGRGVDIDLAEAESWYRKAFEDGDEDVRHDAQVNLARLLKKKEELIAKELDELIGLEDVKKDVRRLFKVLRTHRKRREAGLKAPEMTYHCVFTGNPGTGKTTVARILAKIYASTGVVQSDKFIEAGRSDIVAEYLGQTAVKCNALIDSALGGVLFIDEAYSLVTSPDACQDPYGREAVDTLLMRMENDRRRLVVIVAGYTKEMEEFINSNPGLKSRFTKFFHFPDYTADELVAIFEKIVSAEGYKISPAAKNKVKRIFDTAIAQKPKNFGNAREVRRFCEMVFSRQAERIDDMVSKVTKLQLQQLRAVDIPDALL